ncbi:helicase-like transcription factor [Anneissia japonica]|uniref:helicase-like transcription factor n=1 Tax=Anneissia japonica TaxID=1529436 RepID=UPI0014257756|nr:helicase-like transcription factor [Anneissia japonica]XP_033118247.1 helicase-like transcription factor [Anneissia japonica]
MPWRQRNYSWKQNWPQKKKSSSWRDSNSWSLPSIPGLDMLESSVLSVDALIGNDPLLDDDMDDDPDTQKLLGSIRGRIVGIQYYKGTVNNYEMVGLVREPNNPYDRNAVRVDNVRKQKVGHLKRQLAAGISYIMDKKLARVEGIVPSGKDNKYDMPVDITLWGKPERQTAVAIALAKHSIQFQYPGGEMSNVASSSLGVSGYQPRTSSYTPQLLTQAEMKNELDNIFDSMKEYDKSSCMEPAKAITTKLYTHQKRALQWMVNQENSDHLPPLWEERRGKYMNVATNFITTERPPSIHGGILADDMGLGKTLEVIALIITNFYHSKPLVVPVEDVVIEEKEKPVNTEICQDSGVTEEVKKPVLEVNIETNKVLKVKQEDEEWKEPVKGVEKKKRVPRKKKAAKSKNLGDTGDKTEVENLPSATGVSPNVRRRPKRTTRRPAKYTFSDGEEPSPRKQPRTSELASSDFVAEDITEVAVKMIDTVDTPSMNVESSNIQDDLPLLPSLPTEPTSLPTSIVTISTVNGACSAVSSTVSGVSVGSDATSVSNTSASSDAVATSSVNGVSKPTVIDSYDLTDEPCATASVDVVTSSNESKPPSEVIVLDEDDDDGDDDLPDIQLSHKVPSRTYTRGPRPTLIICPLSVMSNWLQQLKEHVHPHVDIRVYLYYGPDRVRDPKVLASKDIVITTYSTLASDFKAKQERSVLHKTHWLRVVLDEGHTIRNPSSLQSKAAIALTTDRRWILTGTPIQNSMRDLWTLTVFLKLEPFCSDRQWWQRVIARPIAEGNKKALTRVQSLMRAIALRRTKTQMVDGKPLVELPERKVYVQTVELSEEERKVYEAMAKEGRLAIGRYFRAGTLLHHYGDVLSILLRLRQLCCHPALCNKARFKAEIEALIDLDAKESNEVTDEAKKKLVEKLLNVLSQGADEECCVCLESLRIPVITSCAHVFCRPCIEEVINAEKERAACPLCRANVKQNDLVQVPEDKIEPPKPEVGPWQSSAKVDAMMQHLIQLQRDDPTIKSLVVSQFTSLLDLIKKPLGDIGIKFICFDGRMSMKKRTEALAEFSSQDPRSPTVCLLSLKAGGVGLNLVSASRVFLLDPAWNPAAEEQCFDRCHRLGQTRDVVITKFIVKDSVEERMIDLQEKKRNLMVGAFGKKQTAEERQRTRINDIKLLMDL